MKKTLFIIASIALLSTACNKSDVVPYQEKNLGTHVVSINASADSEMTKTAYAGDKTFSWTAGDKISVLMNNGTTNKFFTLTAASGGSASTTFSGPVDDGYDYFGSVADGTKWALYPASDNHEYHEDWTEADAYKILFDLPREVDLSTSFSANIPMKAIGDGENNYSFKPITATFKFTFKVADGISKVKLTVSRASGYYLSGMMPFRTTDGEYLAFEQRQGRGTMYGDVSITRSVETVGSEHVATFYVPYRIYQALKTPTVALRNADNGYTLFSGTATTDITPSDQKRLTIVPTADLTAKGLGSPILGSGIDWSTVDMYPLDGEKEYFPSSSSKITAWKFKSDATNVYFFYKIPTTMDRAHSGGYIVASFDTDNSDASGGDPSYGHGGGMEYFNYCYPFTNASGDPVTFVWGVSNGSPTNKAWTGSGWSSSGTKPISYGAIMDGDIYVETVLPRTSIGAPTSGATIRVNTSVNSYPVGAQTVTLF